MNDAHFAINQIILDKPNSNNKSKAKNDNKSKAKNDNKNNNTGMEIVVFVPHSLFSLFSSSSLSSLSVPWFCIRCLQLSLSLSTLDSIVFFMFLL